MLFFSFLEQNQNQFEKNYFEVLLNVFIERFIPYVTGEQQLPTKGGEEKKKVRFAQSYAPAYIVEVWKKFFNILIAQMTDSFELERTKQHNAQNQKALAPHQHIEQSERKKKRVQEKASEIENTASSYEAAIQQETMHEDPF
ncbi:hypothetical protein WR25_18634 [Diploscapter pachys]|uniref:Uncharacterized protein n=1 Tax=Diploscapter pachys TaxID=2018661 RepID=A0A2A2L4R3_9BILA|nr:hypothetical protein WR25_18634 [Diploscapter pachys]